MTYGNQLPVPCDGLLTNPQQFYPNNPPTIPVVNTIPDIQNALGMISAAVATTISANSSKSMLRVFHFNLASLNGYANGEFAQAVQATCDLILLMLATRQIQMVDQGIGEAAEKACSFTASVLPYTYPALRMYLSPDILDGCAKAAEIGAGIQAQVRILKQQYGINSPNVNLMTNQQYPQGGGYSNMSNNFQGNNGMAMTRYNQIPAFTNSPAGAANNAAFGRYGGNLTGENPNLAFSRHALNPISQNQTQPIAVPQTQQTFPVLNQTQTGNSMKEPCNGEKFDGVYRKAINASKEMDQKKHTLVVTSVEKMYQSISTGKHPNHKSSVAAAIDDLVDATTAIMEVKSADQIDAQKLEQLIKESEQFFNDTCEAYSHVDQAVLAIRKNHFNSSKDKNGIIGKIYQNDCWVTEPVIASPWLEAMLYKASKSSKRFSDLAFALNAILKDDLCLYEDKLAILQIDKTLTAEVNSIIRNNLSLLSSEKEGVASLVMDSFIEDSADLNEYVRKKYGDAYSNALIEYQNTFIKAIFTIEKPQERSATADPIIDFGRLYTITLVNLIEKDLDIVFRSNSANALLESDFPELYKLCNNVVTLYEDNVDQPVYKHLLVTADNTYFRIHRGLVGERWILIEKL